MLHELLVQERIPHTVLNAKQDASEAEIISRAHSEAKEVVSAKISAAKADAEAKLAELSKANESYLQKAEGESSEEVKALRAKAESKKREVAGNVTEMLF